MDWSAIEISVIAQYGRDMYEAGKRASHGQAPAPAQPAPQSSPAAQGDSLSRAARDVLAERRRQVEVEGFDAEHDGEAHDGRDLAEAAACYLLCDSGMRPLDRGAVQGLPHGGHLWPWEPHWWKPKDEYQNLKRAAALVLARMDQLNGADADRAARAPASSVPPMTAADARRYAEIEANSGASDFASGIPLADSVTAPAATVIKKGADRQWMSERLGHLPDGIYSLYLAPPAQPAPQQEPSHTAVQLAELVLSDCGHSSNYTPLLDRVAARIDSHVERRLDELRGCLESKPAPQQEAQDAAFEAVRKNLCALQRYSFCLDDDGVVRRVQDRTGNWIEFDDAHKLFDPVAVDAARKQGENHD